MRVLLDLVLPPRCPGCRREGEVLCRACLRSVSRRINEPPGVPLGLPGDIPRGLAQLEWCSAFTGPTRAALHALKYDGERRLAAPLGELLARRWRSAGVGGEILVPVPIHPRKRRERGYDQAVLLAERAAMTLGAPMVEGLQRREATTAQHALGRSHRTRNVARAFESSPGAARVIRGRWVVLVDDVVTTGATMSGCANALLAAGAVAVSGLAVARER